MVERFNKTLKSTLHMWCNENQDDWDELLPFARFAYNNEYHSYTKENPYFAIHGRNARTAIDAITCSKIQQSTSVHEYVNIIMDRIRAVHDRIKVIYNNTNKERHDSIQQHKEKIQQFNIGELVYLFNPTTKEGMSGKLVKRWDGPYTITRKISKVNYEIIKENRVQTVHANRLKQVLGNEREDNIDIYEQSLRTSEIQLSQLERALQVVTYEYSIKKKNNDIMQDTYKRIADNAYATDNDYQHDLHSRILNPKTNYISHQYIQYNGLRWRKKENINANIISNNSSEVAVKRTAVVVSGLSRYHV